MYNVKLQRNERVYLIEPIFSVVEYYTINVFWWSKWVDLLTVEKNDIHDWLLKKKWYSRLTFEEKNDIHDWLLEKKWY